MPDPRYGGTSFANSPSIKQLLRQSASRIKVGQELTVGMGTIAVVLNVVVPETVTLWITVCVTVAVCVTEVVYVSATIRVAVLV